MNQNIATELTQFIKESPSAFHAVATMKKNFLTTDFTQLQENEKMDLNAAAAILSPATILPLSHSPFRKIALTACVSCKPQRLSFL